MLIKQFLRDHITQHVSIDNFSVEIPKNTDHGDYATNAAFLMAKQQGANPVEVVKQHHGYQRKGSHHHQSA